MDENVHTIEEFYGVYLLYCANPKYKGRTYIGYTVDPNRRIRQHNKGKQAGGAWKTSNKGPWVMVLIVHGFPNDIAALRFEWAWQHPGRSRRLNYLAKKKTKELMYDYCLRILWEMLQIGPWNRLPLTVRWLNQDYVRDFPVDRSPPMHMPVCFGAVISKKLSKPRQESNTSTDEIPQFCMLCLKIIVEKPLVCLSCDCDLIAHVICLAKSFNKVGEYVPVEGKCPRCCNTFLWGDIIRKYKGCYGNLPLVVNTDVDDVFSSDSD